MKLDRARYQRCIEIYDLDWRLIDTTLYRLCQEYPKHTKRDQVYAKLFIIGRTYSTGIERVVATDHTQASSMSTVGNFLLTNGSLVDGLIDEPRGIVEPLTPDQLCKVVSVHGRMVKLISEITRKGSSARSFVSKYLHFHSPAVPIYDNIAAVNAQHCVPWSKSLVVFQSPPDKDDCYADYVMQFFQLYKDVTAAELPVNVKYVDAFLLDLVDRVKAVAVAQDI